VDLKCNSLEDARNAAVAARDFSAWLCGMRAYDRESCACNLCMASRALREATKLLAAEQAAYPKSWP
jgi:hypothetical protein